MSPALIFIVIIISLISLWWYIHFNFWQKRKIPHVRGLFSGSFKELISLKANFTLHVGKIYSDPKFQNAAVVGLYVPHRPALLIRDPELLKSVLNKDFSYFRTRFTRNEYSGDPIGKQILFSAPYKFWKDMRSKLSPMFSGGSLKRVYPLIRKVGENLESHVKKMESGSILEMKNLTNLYTIDIINTTIFGIASNVLENPDDPLAIETKRVSHFNARRYFDWFIMTVLPQFTGVFRSKVYYKETEDFLRTTTDLLIRERERLGSKRYDLIDILVKLKQEAEANGEDMSIFMNDITSQVALLLFAGYDTSTTTLSNALFELAKNPIVQQKLRMEIKQAFTEGNGEISYEALNNSKYLGMVLSETMRRYPPLPLLERQHDPVDDGSVYSLQPFADYSLPSGMAVYISTIGLHHDPKYWPNPDIFDPERFNEENVKLQHPMVYLPFGSGPRNCMGLRLALLMMKSAMAYFLKSHRVQVCERTNLNPELDANVLVPKFKGGIYLQVIRDC